jgi:hypothetical protein
MGLRAVRWFEARLCYVHLRELWSDRNCNNRDHDIGSPPEDVSAPPEDINSQPNGTNSSPEGIHSPPNGTNLPTDGIHSPSKDFTSPCPGGNQPSPPRPSRPTSEGSKTLNPRGLYACPRVRARVESSGVGGGSSPWEAVVEGMHAHVTVRSIQMEGINALLAMEASMAADYRWVANPRKGQTLEVADQTLMLGLEAAIGGCSGGGVRWWRE